MNKFHFFWKGILSNWAKSNFRFDNVNYNCGEQLMMHQKALLFKDYQIANKIMQLDNPKDIKALGRLVNNFDSKIWDNNKYNIILSGLKARCNYDIKFKNELLKHKGKIFVEASPYDRIWGIGYSEQNALNNVNNWGENLLGKILTEIANNL